MKLGIKTTGEVSKLKTKTTDGVVKAVECACCVDLCDPLAPWGPGYDTKPSEIQIYGYTLKRINACQWQMFQCTCVGEIIWKEICDENCYDYDFFLRLDSPELTKYGSYRDIHFTVTVFIPSGDAYKDFVAIRTGGDFKAPYGDYTVVESFYGYDLSSIGDTFTISPP